MTNEHNEKATTSDTQPTLTTERLILRPFTEGDAKDIQRLLSDKVFSVNTGIIPHPYEDGIAEPWIATHAEKYRTGQSLNLAITLAATDELIGSIAFYTSATHQRASMGYWIGIPYWGQGYCTEAARRFLGFGFEQLDFNRIEACHYQRNPESGRVMRKIGMSHEGTLRQHIVKSGVFEDNRSVRPSRD